MWKESLRIGVDLIDEQHKALFDKIEELRKEIQADSANRKQNCIDAILFLKDYTVKHFSEEEAYQQSIGYKYFDAHKKLHEGFIRTLLEHEKKLNASDFGESEVKAFTGMLVAWLLYHVSDADQKIVKETPGGTEVGTSSDMVTFAIGDVLSKMAGYDAKEIQAAPGYPAGGSADGTIAVEVKLTGDATGYIVYTYTTVFVKALMSAIMGYEPQIISELEISALFEVSNIVSGTICRQLSYSKGVTCDISTPFLAEKSSLSPGETIAVDTGRGVVETQLLIEYK